MMEGKMNNDRRKTLTGYIERIDQIKEELETIYSDLEDTRNEEEEARDNLPELQIS